MKRQHLVAMMVAAGQILHDGFDGDWDMTIGYSIGVVWFCVVEELIKAQK